MKPELAKVGPSWDGSNLERWPGVAGIAGETNHLAHNDNPFLPDPENINSTRENTMTGGKSKKKNKTSKKKNKTSKKKNKTNKKKNKTNKKKTQKGGSQHGNTLMPHFLVNLGRNIDFVVSNTWSSFTGGDSPVNPNPMIQPIEKK
jgi:hypothetical protein